VLDAFARGARGTATAGDLADPELDQLIPREREVPPFIARGYTYREVARELVLSTRTVESQVSAVLRKLQLSNRRELGRWARARQLV
jgi:DNA-binding NarL/FixJ family response regulator